MRTFSLALLWLGAVQALLTKEQRSKYTVYKRADDDLGHIFPFPANKSSIVSADTEPGDAPPQDLTVNDTVRTEGGQIPRHFIETKCDAGKKYKIIQAWKEAKELADAQTSYKIGYEYNIPHTQWLGKDWNSESSWIPWKYNYRKLIGDNFGRLRRLFSDDSQSGEYIYWYCYDYSGECGETTQAYTWDNRGWFWSNHYTVFCDQFYERKSMNELLVEHQDNQHAQKVMENFQLHRGQIMFHEIWHYEDLVSSPRAVDYAYQAQSVWDLAKDKGTSWAYVNADSYALDAVAIHVQQHYKSSMSPVPWRELSKLDAEAAAAVSEPPTDSTTAKTFDQTPPKWDGPLVEDDKPDLSVWTELSPEDLLSDDRPPSSTPAPSSSTMPVLSPTSFPDSPPAADQNSCHGISGDYWVMSRDVAIDNVKSFCDQSDATKTYNEGSVNELELSVKNTKGGDKNSPKDAPDCVARFQKAVIDGCDGDDPVNNPHNYKFGSTLATGEGWEYTMTPLSKQVNEVSCDVSYKFWYDAIEIRGKNFPDAKLGADGEGLKKEIGGCGALTEWKFERTPDDCCFQWYAYGQLPIGMKKCVGNAVETAGGSSKGNCKRSMRGVTRRSGIDDWPGYNDAARHIFKEDEDRLLERRDDIDSWPGYGDESKHVFSDSNASS